MTAMDNTEMIPLEAVAPATFGAWNEFSAWYRKMARRHPEQFPLAQAYIRWLMAMRGYQYLTTVPVGPPSALGIPADAQSWYDLNLTERPFLVIVGEVCTILFLADMEHEAYEYIRRLHDLIEWPDGDGYDEGQMFHITQEYVRPTAVFHESQD